MESRLIALKINAKTMYCWGRITLITAIPTTAEDITFRAIWILLNNYNFSLPCLCSHLAVITGKQGLLYFSFYTGTCQMSDWFKEGKKKKKKRNCFFL